MYRSDRRPGLAREWPGIFHARYLRHLWRTHRDIFKLLWRFSRVRKRIKADPNARAYTDLALTPVEKQNAESLALFTATGGARAALAKNKVARKERKRKASARSTLPRSNNSARAS